MKLPFFNSYPYTNFEQLNLDKIMQLIGSFDARITKNTEDIADLNVRLAAETAARIAGDDSLNTALEEEIAARIAGDDSLNTALEEEIAARIAGDNALDSRVTTNENDIADLKTRVTTTEGQIININNSISNHETRITNLENTVSDLEDEVDDIPVVTPNPGGSGTTLNTIQIDNVVYEISGGGGSGSSVTPNPSGTPTDTLNSIDIDGVIYDMPSGGSGSTVIPNPSGTPVNDLTKIGIDGVDFNITDPNMNSVLSNITTIQGDITTIQGDITTIQGDVSDLQNEISTLNSDKVINVAGAGNVINSDWQGVFNVIVGYIPVKKGTNLVIANITFDSIPSNINVAVNVKMWRSSTQGGAAIYDANGVDHFGAFNALTSGSGTAKRSIEVSEIITVDNDCYIAPIVSGSNNNMNNVTVLMQGYGIHLR